MKAICIAGLGKTAEAVARFCVFARSEAIADKSLTGVACTDKASTNKVSTNALCAAEKNTDKTGIDPLCADSTSLRISVLTGFSRDELYADNTVAGELRKRFDDLAEQGLELLSTEDVEELLAAHALLQASNREQSQTQLHKQGQKNTTASGYVQAQNPPFDLAIMSPGIPPTDPLFKAAQSLSSELIGEPEFCFRHSPKRWIAITGTNGKTTTTRALTKMLQRSYIAARAVGNIGEPIVSHIHKRPSDEYFVAELSSFQLYETSSLCPRVGVLLNLTPDHVEWHGSVAAYFDAKMQMFERMAARGGTAVICIDGPETKALATRLVEAGCKVVSVSSQAIPEHTPRAYLKTDERGTGLYVELESGTTRSDDNESSAATPKTGSNGRADGVTQTETTTEIVRAYEAANAAESAGPRLLAYTHDITLLGEHNYQNLLAASAAALVAGASFDAVRSVVRFFKPIEHRLEQLGQVAGVNFVNDSKATNTDSACKAVKSFPIGKAIVLLGGHDKQTPLDELVVAVRNHAKACVCFGEAGERFEAAFLAAAREQTSMQTTPHEQSNTQDVFNDQHARMQSSSNQVARTQNAGAFTVQRAAHLAHAFYAAVHIAQPGDTVVLSPACSSFDEFSNMAERGRAFKALVQSYAAAHMSAGAHANAGAHTNAGAHMSTYDPSTYSPNADSPHQVAFDSIGTGNSTESPADHI